ncbi:uncharacterized protein KD926_001315 [Aspergillus affinis]|uniref:uncharacterized protein n=1 Tax=Aspergillus affinis TaxID=1070780 RepID=UPI0022FEFC29|nr:uncharacterized protein KD926_001315 [Aspergillus affinis]KAI9036793.1 hypothetical protein KD926_001315 [Aspergillus affinis]
MWMVSLSTILILFKSVLENLQGSKYLAALVLGVSLSDTEGDTLAPDAVPDVELSEGQKIRQLELISQRDCVVSEELGHKGVSLSDEGAPLSPTGQRMRKLEILSEKGCVVDRQKKVKKDESMEEEEEVVALKRLEKTEEGSMVNKAEIKQWNRFISGQNLARLSYTFSQTASNIA